MTKTNSGQADDDTSWLSNGHAWISNQTKLFLQPRIQNVPAFAPNLCRAYLYEAVYLLTISRCVQAFCQNTLSVWWLSLKAFPQTLSIINTQ